MPRGAGPRDRRLAPGAAPAVVPGGPATRGRPALAAEKGALREVGSLLFHWAFILILVGVVLGKGTGFTGRAVVVEGQTWTDAQANYDGRLRTGRFFGGDSPGVGIQLVDFEDDVPTERAADGLRRARRAADADGTSVGAGDIRVNHPAAIDGVEFFQFGYGWAPVVEVTTATACRSHRAGGSTQDHGARGRGPARDAVARLVKLPDARTAGRASGSSCGRTAARARAAVGPAGPSPMLSRSSPIMPYTAYRGELPIRRSSLERA